MKAIAVIPGKPETLEMVDRGEPDNEHDLLVRAVAVGICGTDHEIIEHGHGSPPPGSAHLVLGHESLGSVVEAPPGSGFVPGDTVVGIVRRPDPEPCACCARGRWDMCLNGNYTERGIKGIDGYASEYYNLEPEFAVRVPQILGIRGVLVEPTSIVTKAWNRIEAIAEINCRALSSVLVTGAGPIGLLAALLGRLRGLEVHLVDRVTEGRKPDLAESLEAVYHQALDDVPPTDVVIECTGAPALIPAAIDGTRRNSIVCLTGVTEHALVEVDVGALNNEVVLENDVVLGTVNASSGHYEEAVGHLVAADQDWLDRIITSLFPLEDWRHAYERREDDVKSVVVFDDGALGLKTHSSLR